MPGCTFHAGPAQVRVNDVAVAGAAGRRIIDLHALGSVGKILRFEDGTTRELRLGQTILVHRPAARVAGHD
jgi:hypothetical protein